MAILIKRYANRKLYNTDTSRYITLKGIAELLDAGEEVRVVDNETGEDITNVALSQILVDSERANTGAGAQSGLLTQMLGKGGDALYEALRRGVDDASENFEEIQDRFRRFVGAAEQEDRMRSASARGREDATGRSEGSASEGTGRTRPGGTDGRRLADWIAYASPDVDLIVQNAVERVFKLLDLPRRSDVDALNENLQRVARAVEGLEHAWARRTEAPPASTSEGASPAPEPTRSGSEAPDRED